MEAEEIKEIRMYCLEHGTTVPKFFKLILTEAKETGRWEERAGATENHSINI
jgi:hypothetical protein